MSTPTPPVVTFELHADLDGILRGRCAWCDTPLSEQMAMDDRTDPPVVRCWCGRCPRLAALPGGRE